MRQVWAAKLNRLAGFPPLWRSVRDCTTPSAVVTLTKVPPRVPSPRISPKGTTSLPPTPRVVALATLDQSESPKALEDRTR